MSAEIYQAQVIKNFFDTITGTDRNLTRVYMCVISLAKLRMEPPEQLSFLVDQLKKSRQKRELSIDLIDYVCTCAVEIEMRDVQTAFGVQEISEMADSFGSISLDTL
ncbi:hypothetical protein F1737_01245 [Methanoplanus sp. FWC-SCC4]|uniref:Uncharacterized protein n=1 Tax=Methanochimaera problematica TaxID=2609417 RepID=A0AA97I1Q4_9EURY|nr:hypothetical protein [Methanoplanus sp. FWC-SCC4]WOF15405.1 hypothetical protein F1737_01245 [Methanoplanus sp. FWC-SCC4]